MFLVGFQEAERGNGDQVGGRGPCGADPGQGARGPSLAQKELSRPQGGGLWAIL